MSDDNYCTTISIKGYQWCLLHFDLSPDYYPMIRLHTGEMMIYCRLEDWRKGDHGGTRIVPVKKIDMETCDMPET